MQIHKKEPSSQSKQEPALKQGLLEQADDFPTTVSTVLDILSL